VYINARSLTHSNYTRYFNTAPPGSHNHIVFVGGEGVGDTCGRAYCKVVRAFSAGEEAYAKYLL
jgi:hypothetical protein